MRRPLLAVTVAFVLVSCAVSPTGRQQLQLFPAEQMDEMGAAAFQQIQTETPTVEDTPAARYVRCVADAITAQLSGGPEWDVRVFQDASANAFALPGGKIGVHTGLLEVAQTPDQLAAVVGHEIGHVLAQHANERVSTSYATGAGLQLIEALLGGGSGQQQNVMALLGLGAQYGIMMPFSRTQESEADQIGLELMARAGFDPREAVTLWQNMERAGGAQPPEFLSTHPSSSSRIANLQKLTPAAMNLFEQARARGLKPNCSR